LRHACIRYQPLDFFDLLIVLVHKKQGRNVSPSGKESAKPELALRHDRMLYTRMSIARNAIFAWAIPLKCGDLHLDRIRKSTGALWPDSQQFKKEKADPFLGRPGIQMTANADLKICSVISSQPHNHPCADQNQPHIRHRSWQSAERPQNRNWCCQVPRP